MIRIRLVISGRGYHAASGVPEQLELPAGSGVDDALAAVARLLGAEKMLSPQCLVAVGGVHIGTIAKHESRPLGDGDELLLIAPVAGG